MAKCTRCRWHLNKFGINKTPFFGNKTAEIVLVGEAFGKTEAIKGEAFVGKSGEKLTELITIAGLKREELAIMNSMRCYQSENPTPTPREMDACFIYTYIDLQTINPKLVVALGASAFYHLTGKSSDEFAPYVGKLLWSDKIKRKVYVVNHPASALYDNKRWDILVSNFRQLQAKIDEEPFTIKNYKYNLIREGDNYNLMFDVFEETRTIYLDIESTGLNPYKDEFRCLQLGDDSGNIAVIEPEILKDITFQKRLKTLIEKKGIVGQDFTFDIKWLYAKMGIFPESWSYDTCIAEFIISGMKNNDLDNLIRLYASESYGYSEEITKAGGAHKMQNLNKLYQYAANDIGVLPVIRNRQSSLLNKNNFNWAYENIFLPCNKVLTKISLRGITYDLDRLKEVDRLYEGRAERCIAKILNLDSVRVCEKHFKRKFNARSSEMIRWLLLDYYKLPVLKTQKKSGKPSIGKEEMKKYAISHENEYCQAMEKYRSFQNIRDNFLSGVTDRLDGNIAHTSYGLHATATGRPNSKDPNLLNIPRTGEVKSVFISRPGYKFVYADFSQVEIRCAAVIYNDPALIDLCNTDGKDFHTMTSCRMYGTDYDKFYKKYCGGDKKITEMRSVAKTITFGVLYQMSAPRLAYELGISHEDAQNFIIQYFRGFPDLEENIERLKRQVIAKGYIDNYFGFRRRWRNHTEEDRNTLREAVNFPIQSVAWNLVQLALIEIDKKLGEFHTTIESSGLVMQIYDSIVVEAKEEEVDAIASMMYDVMTNINKPFKQLNKVKLLADFEIGNRLSEMEKYESPVS